MAAYKDGRMQTAVRVQVPEQLRCAPDSALAGLGGLMVSLTLTTHAQNAGYGGYSGNGGGYAAGYSTLIPRVMVAPGGYGGRGIRYVTVPTPTRLNQDMARSFFAAGGLRTGCYERDIRSMAAR